MSRLLSPLSYGPPRLIIVNSPSASVEPPAAFPVLAKRKRAGVSPALFVFLFGTVLPAPALAATAFTVPIVPAATAAATATATIEAAAKVAAAAVPVAAATETTAAATTTAAAETATAAPAAAETAAATTETTAPAAAKPTAGARNTPGLRLEAVAAIDGTVTPRLERYLGFFPARCARRIEQLPWGPAIAKTAAAHIAILLLLQPPAVWAPPWLPREPF